MKGALKSALSGVQQGFLIFRFTRPSTFILFPILQHLFLSSLRISKDRWPAA